MFSHLLSLGFQGKSMAKALSQVFPNTLKLFRQWIKQWIKNPRMPRPPWAGKPFSDWMRDALIAYAAGAQRSSIMITTFEPRVLQWASRRAGLKEENWGGVNNAMNAESLSFVCVS
jgi:hypothetical protein